MEIEVHFLELAGGVSPYREWEKKLDEAVRGIVRIRINRIRLGGFGDCKVIKGHTGLYELRIHQGPGYRIYFGKAKNTLIILVCGGDKKTQKRDIARAGEYWQLYKNSAKGKKV